MAEGALAAATSIGQALLAGSPSAQPTVASGSLGAALLLTSLAEVTGDRAYADAASAVLDDAVNQVTDLGRPDIGLHSAPVGLGWTAAVIRGRLPGWDDDEENDVDAFVDKILAASTWPGPLDVVFGLAGLGAYCLARLPSARARHGLSRVVGHLASAAREDEDGVTWPYVPPTTERSPFTDDLPEGHIDLGFAHGVPGLVTFLAEAHRAGDPDAGPLLARAARWLAARQLPPGSQGAFPAAVVDGRLPTGTRLGWCYGDPGVAAALLAAGDALGDTELVERARATALGCAARDPGEITDAALCHGSAGLGHLFHRLGRGLADDRVLNLSRQWFAETLVRMTSADAVRPGPGLLLGPAGVGLALLSAATDVEPWWDGVLLVRPPGAWGGVPASYAAGETRPGPGTAPAAT